MEQAVIEGTWDEIKRHEAEFNGHKLRLIIDPIDEDGDDLMAGIPDPPFTVRDREHLVELLLEGLDSGPGIEVTPAFWDDLHSELRQRAISRHGIRAANA